MSRLDSVFMLRAVALASRGRGGASPNPLVGAVLVRGERIVAEGWHERYGDLHAEAMALSRAGSAAEGATLYCTLEPCCFRGAGKKQPPCSEHIIKAGVKRVVIANTDPHPEVSGRGIEQLRRAGLEVTVGSEAEAAARLNQGFFTRVTQHRPFVQLKVAQSLDGCLACQNGQSRWITDKAARELAHVLRAESDAVLVGSGTALADNPSLTVRLPGKSVTCPLRVVLDRRLRLPLELKLFSDPWRERTVLVCDEGARPKNLAPYLERGVQVLPLPRGTGQLSVLFARLADKWLCNRVLVEGGAKLLASLVSAELYDHMAIFVAPILLGGRASVAELDVPCVNDAPRLRWPYYQRLGDQCVVNGWRLGPMVPGGEASGGWPLSSECLRVAEPVIR